jgi:hypothetical protein
MISTLDRGSKGRSFDPSSLAPRISCSDCPSETRVGSASPTIRASSLAVACVFDQRNQNGNRSSKSRPLLGRPLVHRIKCFTRRRGLNPQMEKAQIRPRTLRTYWSRQSCSPLCASRGYAGKMDVCLGAEKLQREQQGRRRCLICIAGWCQNQSSSLCP